MEQNSFNQVEFMNDLYEFLNNNIKAGVVHRNHKGRQGVLAVSSRLTDENHRIIIKISSNEEQSFLDIAYTNYDKEEPPEELNVFEPVETSTLKYCSDSDHTYRARNLLENKDSIRENLKRAINSMFK